MQKSYSGKGIKVPLAFYQALYDLKKINNKKISSLLRAYPRQGSSLFSRDELLASYHEYVSSGDLLPKIEVAEILRLKPGRTISGVTPITVLTKPYPCPGKCIFCPNDIRMPKSYIATEPGAQRAARNAFDPYLQTYNRMLALKNIGHNTDKIELIILGGTWSFYPLDYRIWFIKRCFEAMNDFPKKDQRPQKPSLYSEVKDNDQDNFNYNDNVKVKAEKSETAAWEELLKEQDRNVQAESRNVGLVIETRPDYIDEDEVRSLRKFGATKIQIGVQNLNESILDLNHRGTTRSQIIKAIDLLRQAGFKIHIHWMPNLFGASVASDKKDYLELWRSIAPDELKIYPTSVIKGTLLYSYYKQGKHKTYTQEELNELLEYCLINTPRFCRLTRIIRDIPSQEIAAGNKITNLRQTIETSLLQKGTPCQCIRCREIRHQKIRSSELKLNELLYQSNVGDEYFLSMDTRKDDKLAGFLRLYLSDKNMRSEPIFPELKDAAVIREVHVYGQVVGLSNNTSNKAQHIGIGKNLIAKAEEIATAKGFKKIAVISAIGTRGYYARLGYRLQGLYMLKDLIS